VRRTRLWYFWLVAVAAFAFARVTAAGEAPARPTILIALTSFRDDNRYANVFRYELTPAGEGKITGKVTPGPKRSDHHPSLSHDGSMAVLAGEVVGVVNQIHFWDFSKKAMVPLPSLNVTTTAQMAPSYCSARGLIACEAWNRPGVAGRWDVLLYDVAGQRFVDTPGLNSARFDERKPLISPDGNWIAFTTNETSNESLTDIRLYDRQRDEVLALPEMNSTAMDTEPALSTNGRFLAFVSDRAAGEGVRDVYLYDRQERQLLPLPGLNSAGQEQSPSISADGRFIAFVSERLDATGERDVYLYDRLTQSLIPTPGLNSAGDEYDPCVIVPSESEIE
jgi:dipeptidyl aminopeptidase/acylaminoacyl peptidase